MTFTECPLCHVPLNEQPNFTQDGITIQCKKELHGYRHFNYDKFVADEYTTESRILVVPGYKITWVKTSPNPLVGKYQSVVFVYRLNGHLGMSLKPDYCQPAELEEVIQDAVRLEKLKAFL